MGRQVEARLRIVRDTKWDEKRGKAKRELLGCWVVAPHNCAFAYWEHAKNLMTTRHHKQRTTLHHTEASVEHTKHPLLM